MFSLLQTFIEFPDSIFVLVFCITFYIQNEWLSENFHLSSHKITYLGFEYFITKILWRIQMKFVEWICITEMIYFDWIFRGERIDSIRDLDVKYSNSIIHWHWHLFFDFLVFHLYESDNVR